MASSPAAGVVVPPGGAGSKDLAMFSLDRDFMRLSSLMDLVRGGVRPDVEDVMDTDVVWFSGLCKLKLKLV
jgi:hypothetical protein